MVASIYEQHHQTPIELKTFHKTSRKQASAPCPRLRPLVPTIIPLLVHVNHIVHLQLQFILAVGWIRRDAPVTLVYRLGSCFIGGATFGTVAAAAIVAAVQRVGFPVVVHTGTGGLRGPVTQLLRKQGKICEKIGFLIEIWKEQKKQARDVETMQRKSGRKTNFFKFRALLVEMALS